MIMSETSISLFPEFLDPDYPQSVENESRNDLADTIRSTLDPVFRDIRKAPDLAKEQADWTGHEGDYLSLIDRARMALGTMAASCWYGMLDENNPYIRKDVGILRGVLRAAAAHKDGLIRYLDRQVEVYDKQSRLPVTRGKSAAELARELAAGNRIERSIYTLSDVLCDLEGHSPASRNEMLDEFYTSKDRLTAAFVRTAEKEQAVSGKVPGIDRIQMEKGWYDHNLLLSVPDGQGQELTVRTHIRGLEDFSVTELDAAHLAKADRDARAREITKALTPRLEEALRGGLTLPACVGLMRETARADADLAFLGAKAPEPYQKARVRLAAAFVPLAEKAIAGSSRGTMNRDLSDRETGDKNVRAQFLDVRPQFLSSDLAETYNLRGQDGVRFAGRISGIRGVRDLSWNKETYDIALCDPAQPRKTEAILSVPTGDLVRQAAEQGIGWKRLVGLAERYSGPFIDVRLTAEAERRVEEKTSSDLDAAAWNLWNRIEDREHRAPDMGLQIDSRNFGDCYTISGYENIGRTEETAGPGEIGEEEPGYQAYGGDAR